MKVLIACEESQAVCIAFRERGHEAYSCDILPCSGGHPEWHIQGDVRSYLDEGWNMMIAFPPCTFISHVGNRALKENPERKQKQMDAVDFFMQLYNAPIHKICVENPRGWMTHYFRREDQVIEPFEFGHPERKRTCLWLKNLPPLMKGPVNPAGMMPKKVIKRKTGQRAGGNYGYYYVQGKKAGEKSKTFPCIAKAMAEQWG